MAGAAASPAQWAKGALRRLEPVAGAERASELDLIPENRDQALVLPRLLHEVARSEAHRLDRQVDRAPRRHHHHRQRAVEADEARQQVEPLLAPLLCEGR